MEGNPKEHTHTHRERDTDTLDVKIRAELLKIDCHKTIKCTNDFINDLQQLAIALYLSLSSHQSQ